MVDIPLAHFTTYLSSLVKRSAASLNGLKLNKKKLQVSPLLQRSIMGKYEATITYICYFSRIIYENRPRKILKSFALFKYSPLTFNKGLSYLTYSSENDKRIEESSKKPYGYLMYDSKQDTPVSITVMDYTMPGNKSVIFPNEKIMVVSFRGTLSLMTALKDLNITYQNLFNLYGKDAFPEEFAEVEKRKAESTLLTAVNPFGAHRGFVNGIIDLYPKILERIKQLLNDHTGISRIFITGHSLGGAYCHLMALGLAQQKKKGIELPDIHAISFGAPKVFTDYARNVFNDLLLGDYMTLDRVANRPRFGPDLTMTMSDPVPYIPSSLDHPGFMILKPETHTQSRTGRTKHMRELRDELFGITPDQSFFSSLIPGALKVRNYNSLPEYKEYVELWLDGLTADEYKNLINSTSAGTVRLPMGPAKKVFESVKRALSVSDSELKAVGDIAEEASKKEINSVTETSKEMKDLADAVVAEQKDTAALVSQGYGGKELPQEGGGPNTDKYKARTVLEQPNHLVYSCSQVTALIPLVGCHLGYMGVGFLGGGINAGSGVISGSRDYKEIAELYCDANGKWTYKPNFSSGSVATLPVMKGGSRKRTIYRRKMRHGTAKCRN